MIVGHLPYLSRLLSALLGVPQERAVVAFQVGGVVHLERDNHEEWRLRWILPPELLSERTSQHRKRRLVHEERACDRTARHWKDFACRGSRPQVFTGRRGIHH